MKTAAQVKREFAAKGLSISQWAMSRNIPPSVVYDLLNSKKGLKATRGMAFKAAVALGIKAAPNPSEV